MYVSVSCTCDQLSSIVYCMLQEWVSISSTSDQTFSLYKGSPNKTDSPHSTGSLLLIRGARTEPFHPMQMGVFSSLEEPQQHETFSSYQRSQNRTISPHANGSLLLIERSHNQTKPSPHTRGARTNRITSESRIHK